MKKRIYLSKKDKKYFEEDLPKLVKMNHMLRYGEKLVDKDE